MQARLSILGLYNYDPTLFDGMVVPERVDLDILKDAIIAECGELAARFPDIDYCKYMITSWSRRKLYQWERVAAVMDLEYNVIENYDKYETETVEGARTENESTTGTETGTLETTDSGTRTNTGTVTTEGDFSNSTANTGTQTTGRTNTHTDTHTDTQSVTGFNSNQLVTHDQTSGNISQSDNGTDTRTDNLLASTSGSDENTTTNNLQETSTGTGTATNEVTRGGTAERTGTERQTRTNRTHGNIGVTTSQQMIESELELTNKLDIYGLITSEFEDYFCLGIY